MIFIFGALQIIKCFLEKKDNFSSAGCMTCNSLFLLNHFFLMSFQFLSEPGSADGMLLNCH